jgi:hypothetical protein
VLCAVFLAVSTCLYCEQGQMGPFGMNTDLRACLYIHELRSKLCRRCGASRNLVYVWSAMYVHIHVYMCKYVYVYG